MNRDLMKRQADELIPYLQSQGQGLVLPTPFERDIFLFDAFVASTTHIDHIEAIQEELAIGDKLVFFREPDNPHDSQAIRIETIDRVKIGYIPREDNIIFSRLMDAGKLLFGKITDKEMCGKWLRMKIEIYLHES